MICASCGYVTNGPTELCWNHTTIDDAFWAATNKLMCDFLHRRLIPPRVPWQKEDADLSVF